MFHKAYNLQIFRCVPFLNSAFIRERAEGTNVEKNWKGLHILKSFTLISQKAHLIN
uniref:Uncharacterized protein n=1 Tax=Rhizophora mucronata TaxID=61149 RepID=A0A2P2NFN3_RHIMU